MGRRVSNIRQENLSNTPLANSLLERVCFVQLVTVRHVSLILAQCASPLDSLQE